MKLVIISILLLAVFIPVIDDAMNMPNRHKKLRHTGKMYQAKPGHWCRWCSAGYYLVKHCNHHKGLSGCKRCPENHFMNKQNNQTSCIQCSYCQQGQNLVQNCTKTNDIVCQCQPGRYWYVYQGGTGICRKHSVCTPGTIIVKEGTAWNDTECGQSTTTYAPNLTLLSSTTFSPISTASSSNICVTSPSSNIEPSESDKLCSYLWFWYSMVTTLVIIVLVFVILYLWMNKTNSQRVVHQPSIEMSSLLTNSSS